MAYKTEIRCFKRWLVIKNKSEFGEYQEENKITGEAAQPTITSNLSSQWSPVEDVLLIQKVKEFGTQNWVIIARFLKGRLGRQCRERWHNVLNPDIVRREWTKEEDAFIIKMQSEVGSKWAQFSKMEPLLGRTVS